MKKIGIVIFTVFLLGACSKNSAISIGVFSEKLAEENTSSTVDIVYNQKAYLELDRKKPTIIGTQTTTFTNASNVKMDKIVFHLYADSYNSKDTMPDMGMYPELGETSKTEDDLYGGISIIDVAVNGKKNVDFSDTNQVLIIEHISKIEPGETVEIIINFEVELPYSLQRLGYFDDIYSITQWYPLLSKYDAEHNAWDEKPFHPVGESDFVDPANYTVEMNVPKYFEVVSSGKDIKSEEKDRVIYTASIENARHFVFITSPEYAVYEEEYKGIKFRSAYLKGAHSEEKAGVKIIEEVKKIFDYYQEYIGPYIYDEFDVAETGVVGFAMEYSGLIQMEKYEDAAGDFFQPPVYLLAHETAHQWFYSAVGSDSFHEPFMDEGFTHFLTISYVSLSYDMKVDEFIYGYNEFNNINRAVDAYTANAMFDYNQNAYFGPVAILSDLQNLVGDKVFNEILQSYYKEYTGSFGTLDKFLQIVEEQTDASTAKKVQQAFTAKKYVYGDLSTQ